jgi:hypothetical protein
MYWNVYGWKRSWCNIRYYLGIFLEGLRKTTRNIGIVGLLVESLIQDLANTKQTCWSRNTPSLWDSKFYCRVHKQQQFDSTLSQIISVHIPTIYYYKIHFNIILPHTPVYSTWSLPMTFSNYNYLCFDF